jgi:hypothetical protein
MLRFVLAALALISVVAGANAQNAPQPTETGMQAQMLIVDRNAARIIYDDGRNDLFCVTQRIRVGYNPQGAPIYRRIMRCR